MIPPRQSAAAQRGFARRHPISVGWASYAAAFVAIPILSHLAAAVTGNGAFDVLWRLRDIPPAADWIVSNCIERGFGVFDALRPPLRVEGVGLWSAGCLYVAVGTWLLILRRWAVRSLDFMYYSEIIVTPTTFMRYLVLWPVIAPWHMFTIGLSKVF